MTERVLVGPARIYASELSRIPRFGHLVLPMSWAARSGYRAVPSRRDRVVGIKT